MAKGLEGIVTSAVYWGDNLEVLRKIPSGSVDLIYLDPPFSGNKKYWVIWGNDAELEAYEKGWKGQVRVYVDWMRERVELMHKVLKDTGSFYLHCDWQTGHYLKVMLDDVFNYNNFKNEIIWFYPDSPGRSQRDFPRKHDTIFRYVKSKKWTFNDKEVRVPILEASKERYKSPRILGGKAYVGGKSAEIGKIPEDVWRIPVVKQNSAEAKGYHTQKPVALLKRIISASSNEGEIVLDPFCGCGTTLAAAYELGRQWVGIDIVQKACEVMKERMQELEAPLQIIPWSLREKQIKYLESMSGEEFQNWLIIRIGGIPKRGRNGGIDLYTSQLEPVQAKNWRNNVGPAVLRDFRTALQDERKQRGYIVSTSGFTKSAYEAAARYKADEGLEINLVNIKDLDSALQ